MEEQLNEFILSLKEDEKSPATIKKYESNIKAFLEFSKNMELSKATIIQFKEKLDTIENYMPNTTNNYLIVLNKFLKFFLARFILIELMELYILLSIFLILIFNF